jgi:MFS family permease
LFAAVPTFVAILLILFFVKDVVQSKARTQWSVQGVFEKKFLLFLSISFLFTIGNSSDAFLVLQAKRVGEVYGSIFLLLAFYSAVAAISGMVFSRVSDHFPRKRLLAGGWMLYSVLYFLFARITTPDGLWILFGGYGLYAGLTEGIGKAMVSDCVKKEHRGAAYGWYGVVVGATLLPASVMAGLLWQFVGPSAPFLAGSLLSAGAVILLLLFF